MLIEIPVLAQAVQSMLLFCRNRPFPSQCLAATIVQDFLSVLLTCELGY